MPDSQAWMDHGFAFLTINYRGSTTFGREFQEKIWGDVGHWEMEDLAAANLTVPRRVFSEESRTLPRFGMMMSLLPLTKQFP